MMLTFNKATFEAAKKALGIRAHVKDNNGNEFARVPFDPDALLFWAAAYCSSPLFDDSGWFCQWEAIDDEKVKTIKTVVEETARMQCYGFEGLDKLLGPDCDVARRLFIVIACQPYRRA